MVEHYQELLKQFLQGKTLVLLFLYCAPSGAQFLTGESPKSALVVKIIIYLLPDYKN